LNNKAGWSLLQKVYEAFRDPADFAAVIGNRTFISQVYSPVIRLTDDVGNGWPLLAPKREQGSIGIQVNQKIIVRRGNPFVAENDVMKRFRGHGFAV
jgi:hypothetical protein